MALVTARSRAVFVGGSAVFWLGLGYLALTQAPNFATFQFPDGPVITTTVNPPKPPPQIHILPDPEPVKTVKRVLPQPAQTPTSLTTRPTTPPPVDYAGPRSDLAIGAPPSAPATGTGDLPLTINPGPSLLAPIDIAPLPVVPPPEPIVKAPPAPPPLVLNPVRLAGTSPSFPDRALERGIEGEVVLAFTVTASGKVEGLSVASESPGGYGFGRAALSAFRDWTFQPQTIDGIAVAYPARYTVSFKLVD